MASFNYILPDAQHAVPFVHGTACYYYTRGIAQVLVVLIIILHMGRPKGTAKITHTRRQLGTHW